MTAVCFPIEIDPADLARSTPIHLSCFKANDFALCLPNGWKQCNSEENRHATATWRHTLFLDAVVTITPYCFHEEVAPGDFLEAMIHGADPVTILARNDEFGPGGVQSDILAQNADGTLVRRETVVKDGSKIVHVFCIGNSVAYPEIAADFLTIISTSRFSAKRVALAAVPLVQVLQSSTKRPLFSIPAHWQCSRCGSPSGMYENVRAVRHRESGITGVIQICSKRCGSHVDGSAELQAIVRGLKEEVTDEGSFCGPAIFFSAMPLDGFSMAAAGTFPIRDKLTGIGWEYSVVCHWRCGEIVTAVMKSPSKISSPLVWAENKRAFELVCSTLCGSAMFVNSDSQPERK